MSVPVPLSEDPYEAISQAYLVRTDNESEPFAGEAEAPESPHFVAPPTCRVEESEGSGTSGARSTSSDSTARLSPDHPLTKATPVLVPSLCRIAHLAMRVLPAMLPGLSTGIAEVAAMYDLAFRKSKEDDEVEESSNSDSESEDTEDEGPTIEDEDPAARDEGLATRDEGPESDGFVLREEEDEAILEGQQQAVPVVGTVMSESLGLGYRVLRRQELALEGDYVYSTFEVGQRSGSMPEPERSERVSASRQPTLTTWTDSEDGMVYIDVPTYLPPAPPLQTPPSPEWSPGSFPISSAPSIVPSPISSPIMSSVRALLEYTSGSFSAFRRDATRLFAKIDRDFGALWRLVLALEAWVGRVDTHMIDMSRAGYDDRRLVYDMLLQQTALHRELQ
nr:hypothetical protein [Tanacetum cinerariifolium]